MTVVSAMGFTSGDTISASALPDDLCHCSRGDTWGSVFTLAPIDSFEGQVYITVTVTDDGDGNLRTLKLLNCG